MTWRLVQGECVAAMRAMPEASVDAVVCDPPYGLEFMGREWDGADGFRRSLNAADVGRDDPFGRASRTSPEYRAGELFERWCESWARQALRLLKPGGWLLAFGGTRTSHRLACGIEDAGFELRDSILAWLYGKGFPKSLNVGRAIDMELCSLPGDHYMHETSLPKGEDARPGDHVCPRTLEGEPHRGEGTGLKPSQEPIVVARKPLAGTVAENVLRHGTGALNVHACRVGSGKRVPSSPSSGRDGNLGRWPPNLLLTHHPECAQVGVRRVRLDLRVAPGTVENAGTFQMGSGLSAGVASQDVPIMECAPGCWVAELDRQSGEAGASAPVMGTEPSSLTSNGIYGKFNCRLPGQFYGDRGGASRFFPAFRYVTKPARAERDAGLWDLRPASGGEATDREDDSAGTRSPRAGAGRLGGSRNTHPTVKPLALMEWLCALAVPPAGTVLDPFVGSGTTGCAAVRLGLDFVGIDQDPHYIRIAERRIRLAEQAPRGKTLADLERGEPVPDHQMALFTGGEA